MKKMFRWPQLNRSSQAQACRGIFCGKYSQGLTLVEVIVAISLASLVLISLYQVYATSYQSYRRNISKAEINQNARIALERITRDLRQTNEIVTTLPATNTDPLNPAPSNLEFVDGHNTTKLQYINYVYAEGELHREVVHYYFSTNTSEWVAWNAKDQYDNPPQSSIDEDAIKADKLTSLSFFGTNIISIVLTVEENGQTQTYQTQVLGRNI
ncbi:MAG: hypothetical protein UT28_C0001G0255 [Berkelbacteria bacterium GW2011_GWE1_39_12]|uniref:Prepilin-type N-terminal cleavage/methylation domain-containing protein n=1 Tax=Berkelbacteria bacterium GW2011_GWE1_39_12 TaxID=1618337 RepID=A0A0G4B287_9BACT|nr:MAG: hypothetical protein UT28_C0001G0255 [Berkelbacteria bacterium GW2011_GWE1_39_12]